jgi:hypothetical protein
MFDARVLVRLGALMVRLKVAVFVVGDIRFNHPRHTHKWSR